MTEDMQSFLVRGTAWLSFAFYIGTLHGWLRQPPFPSRTLRWLWTCGTLVFAFHIACAFQLVHHWSHQTAWEATRLQGGYGDGVYLNYLVLIVWLGDVIWWWAAEQAYLMRRRWVDWLIHGFLFFMWFNAAVVFAHEAMKAVGIAGFAFLAVTVLQNTLSHRTGHPR